MHCSHTLLPLIIAYHVHPPSLLCHCQVALGALCIPQMHCRQRNECALGDKIACIQRVVESRDSIKYLLEVEDYLGALEVGQWVSGDQDIIIHIPLSTHTHFHTLAHTLTRPLPLSLLYLLSFPPLPPISLIPLIPPSSPLSLSLSFLGDPRVPHAVRRGRARRALLRAGDGPPAGRIPRVRV